MRQLRRSFYVIFAIAILTAALAGSAKAGTAPKHRPAPQPKYPAFLGVQPTATTNSISGRKVNVTEPWTVENPGATTLSAGTISFTNLFGQTVATANVGSIPMGANSSGSSGFTAAPGWYTATYRINDKVAAPPASFSITW